jgi:hypothetical protein
MPRIELRILPLLGLALGSVAAVGQNTSAMVYTSGSVNVNGAAVQRSAALFNGDKIATAAGEASVADPAFGAVLDPHTTAMLKDGVLQMGCGRISVSTKQFFPTQVGSLQIRPDNPAARYVVQAQNGQITIVALDSTLTVVRGSQTFHAAPGQVMRFAQACSADPAMNLTQPPAAGTAPVITAGVKAGTAMSFAPVGALGSAGGAVGLGIAMNKALAPSTSPTN